MLASGPFLNILPTAFNPHQLFTKGTAKLNIVLFVLCKDKKCLHRQQESTLSSHHSRQHSSVRRGSHIFKSSKQNEHNTKQLGQFLLIPSIIMCTGWKLSTKFPVIKASHHFWRASSQWDRGGGGAPSEGGESARRRGFNSRCIHPRERFH